MNMVRSNPVQNHLLASLPEGEFHSLKDSLTWVRLVPNQILTDKGEIVEHAYFIDSGLVSAQDVLPPNSFIQVAMLGRECLVGGEGLLPGHSVSPVSYVVQQPSLALRIPMPELKRLLPLCPQLELACTEALRSLIQQIVETAGSNARSSVNERFVRLLLIMHDRVDGDDLLITHEASSAMLGVRRTGVTLVASGLQDSGLIQVGRGRITVLDRRGLERQVAQGSWASPSDRGGLPVGGMSRQNGRGLRGAVTGGMTSTIR